MYCMLLKKDTENKVWYKSMKYKAEYQIYNIYIYNQADIWKGHGNWLKYEINKRYKGDKLVGFGVPIM